MRNKINLVNGNFITLENTCPNAEMISIDSGKIAGINAVNHNYDNIDWTKKIKKKFFYLKIRKI